MLDHLFSLTWAAVFQADSLFFWVYVLSSFALTIGAMIFAQKYSIRDALTVLFDRTVWLTRSTRTDCVVTVFYLLVFSIPTGALQTWIGVQIYQLVYGSLQAMGSGPALALGYWLEGGLLALFIILAFDFATYIGHLTMHKISWLWDIHVVHHSPQHLNMFSAYRQNPLDRLLRNSLGAVFTGVTTALFHWCFPGQAVSLTIMGMGAGFFLFMLTAHLQHSHVPVQYPRWLRRFLLSPHVHMIHHSSAERHRDKNFGGIFPFWDQIFGTYHEEDLEVGDLKFGISDHDPIQHSIVRCYTNPLTMWLQKINKHWFAATFDLKASDRVRTAPLN